MKEELFFLRREETLIRFKYTNHDGVKQKDLMDVFLYLQSLNLLFLLPLFYCTKHGAMRVNKAMTTF